MGRKYSVAPAEFAPGGAKTLLEIVAGALRGFRLEEILISSIDTAGATVVEIQIKRITASGTGTSITPNPLRDGDVAFSGTAEFNHTVEPTKDEILWREHVNILPGVSMPLAPGRAFECLATTANGLCIEAIDAPGTTVAIDAIIDED